MAKCQSVWVFAFGISKLNLFYSQIWGFWLRSYSFQWHVYLVFCSQSHGLSLFFYNFGLFARSVFVSKQQILWFAILFFPIVIIMCIERYWKYNKKWKIKLRIACTFVWFVDTTARFFFSVFVVVIVIVVVGVVPHIFIYTNSTETESEVYQFIFFLWCIGNLIFSSIWKEKCSFYSFAAFHCVCIKCSQADASLFFFSIVTFTAILP